MAIGKPHPDPKVLEAEEKAVKTSTSKGERLFDLLTYGGIGFLGVFAAGIPIGYWGKYGGGAGMFKSSAKALEKLGMSAKAADDAVMTSVLMQPGNVGLIPIKWMENRKPELVEKFNKMLGDKSADASVEHDPQQTWGSLIKSRLAAWLAVFAGFRGAAHAIGEKKFGAFENAFAEKVCNVLGKATHVAPAGVVLSPEMLKTFEYETKAFRYGKIAALDVFATAAATVLLYAASRVFAKKNPEWHAKHAHLDEKIENKAQEAAQEAAMTKGMDSIIESKKIFTESVTPAEKPTLKPRSESFSDTISSQKAMAAEATPSLSA